MSFTNKEEEFIMSKYFFYQSIYAPFFKQFIAIKQAQGFVSLRTEWIFLEFDNFFLNIKVAQLGITKNQIDRWRATRINDSTSTIYTKYSILSQFCKFMCKIGYDSYIPRLPVNNSKNSFTPYIFSQQQMVTIFNTCDNLRLYDGHMSTILFIVPAIIRLLYGTGMRISEALSLRNKDVDVERKIILIKKSKNKQERLSPLSDTVVKVLKQYTQYRNQMPVPHINDENSFFFVSPNGTYCRSGSVYNWFRKVLSKSGVPHQGNHRGPRVHDLRHTFAVHSLVKMAKSGLNLYYALPLLSTFLGHKSLGATEQYVRLTSEMYPELLAAQKDIGTDIFPKPKKQIYDGNN